MGWNQFWKSICFWLQVQARGPIPDLGIHHQIFHEICAIYSIWQTFELKFHQVEWLGTNVQPSGIIWY